MESKNWTRMPATALDAETYGQVVDVWRHKRGGLLVQILPLPKRSKQHKSVGMWYVALGNRMLHRKSFYSNEISSPPVRWAANILRLERKGQLHRVYVRDPDAPTIESSKPLETPPL